MTKLGTRGPWGMGLLILGGMFVLIGVGYFLTPINQLRQPLRWLNESPYFPVHGLAWLWIGVGLYSIYQALTPPQRFLNLLPSIGLLVLWSSISFTYWFVFGIVDGNWTIEWQSGVFYSGFAGAIAAYGWCVNPPKGRPRRISA
jgi:hypothetical protein